MSAMEDLEAIQRFLGAYSPAGTAEILARYARLSAICKAFDEAEGIDELVSKIQSFRTEGSGFNILDDCEAADLIRAHVARETMAKDKRIAELEVALERISCRTDHGSQEPCEICAICDAALAGQAKEEGR